MKAGRSLASAVSVPHYLVDASRCPASGVSISQRPVMAGWGPATAVTVLQKLGKAFSIGAVNVPESLIEVLQGYLHPAIARKFW